MSAPRFCPLCRIRLSPEQTTCPRDGQEGIGRVLTSLPGNLLKRFTVVEPFASGGTGDLYIVDESDNGRRGLLKLFHPTSVADLLERGRWLRELQRQAELQQEHLAIPFAAGEVDGRLWCFRPWIDGISLRVKLARVGKMPPQEVLDLALQACQALSTLHKAGLTFGDVKPGHVLITPRTQGNPKITLIDAGIALLGNKTEAPTALSARPTSSTTSFAPGGLPGLTFSRPSVREDMYRLGRLLYESLLGRATPTRGTITFERLEQELGSVGLLSNHVAPFATVLHRLLEGSDNKPPPSAVQTQRMIEPFVIKDHTAKAFDQRTQSYTPPAIIPTPEELALAIPPGGLGTLKPPGPSLIAPAKPAQPGQPVRAKATQAFGMPAVQAPDNNVPRAHSHKATQAFGMPAVPQPAQAESPFGAREPSGKGVPPPTPVTAPVAYAHTLELVADTSNPPPKTSLNPDDLIVDVSIPPGSRRPPPQQAARAVSLLPAPTSQITTLSKRTVIIAAAVLVLVVVGVVKMVTRDKTPDAPPVATSAPSVAAKEDVKPQAVEAKPEAKDVVATPPAEPTAAEPTATDDEAVVENEVQAEPAAPSPTRMATPKAGARAKGKGKAAKPVRVAKTKAGKKGRALAIEAPSVSAKDEARSLFKEGRYAQAAQAYKQATKQNPGDAESFAGLGACELKLKHLPGALAAYQQAESLAPQRWSYVAAVGRVYELMNNRPKAIAKYKRALELSPQQAGIRTALERLAGR